MTHAIKPTPISAGERIRSLDVLRGFALLGILLMNIQDMSMIGAAYFNPTAYGDLTGVNRLVWSACHMFADTKFMALFSMLFGAGIIVFSGRLEEAGKRPAGLHYRRTFWLLVFGMLHAYLIWAGDILYCYALCALVVYLFRRLRPRWLIPLGLLTLGVSSGLYLLAGWSMPQWPAEQVAEMSEAMWAPAEESKAAEIADYQGGFGEQMKQRVPAAIMMQTQAFAFWTGWRAAGLMLIGMALFKLGVLSAKRSDRFYALMAILGFAVGIPVIAYGMELNARHGWSFEYSFFTGTQLNYWGSLGICAGYIGAVMLLLRRLKGAKLWEPLAAVGRMAFTNYIFQSVMCTWVFYGHGLGLYGRVERIGQLGIVLAVWAMQLFLSTIWMRRFHYGPLEWLWRSLTYWKAQPFRKAV